MKKGIPQRGNSTARALKGMKEDRSVQFEHRESRGEWEVRVQLK